MRHETVRLHAAHEGTADVLAQHAAKQENEDAL
jgi:hypothetical protein